MYTISAVKDINDFIIDLDSKTGNSFVVGLRNVMMFIDCAQTPTEYGKLLCYYIDRVSAIKNDSRTDSPNWITPNEDSLLCDFIKFWIDDSLTAVILENCRSPGDFLIFKKLPSFFDEIAIGGEDPISSLFENNLGQ